MPCAIAAAVRIEHGAMIMPSVGYEPLEIGADWSIALYDRVASACTSAMDSDVSCSSVRAPQRLMHSSVSTSSSRSVSSTRTPKTAPVAPVIATTSSHVDSSCIAGASTPPPR